MTQAPGVVVVAAKRESAWLTMGRNLSKNAPSKATKNTHDELSATGLSATGLSASGAVSVNEPSVPAVVSLTSANPSLWSPSFRNGRACAAHSCAHRSGV